MGDDREQATGQPRDFAVRFESDAGGQTVAAVCGEVDLYTAPRLREELEKAIEDGRQQLVLDLTELDFIDSTGLGVLVGAMKKARQSGGDVSLRNASRSTYKILEIAGLTKLFSIE